jgi:hypothetical protein
MKYRIIINYNTGDSFSNVPNQEETLDGEWESLDVAKENLQSIKEHYMMNIELSRATPKKKEEILEKNSDKSWFCPRDGKLVWDSSYSLKLKMDNGNYWQISTGVWCGYFESLNSAKIVPDDTGMTISFE